MMKRSRQKFLFFVPILFLFGCAHFADPSRHCADQLSKRIECLTFADFPPPEQTPFDGTNALRKAFLSGYTNGVVDGIRVKGAWRNLSLFSCDTEEDDARVTGWKYGRDDVTKRIKSIVEVFTADMTRAFSNRYQEVSFHLNGQLGSLADFRADPTGGVCWTSYTEWYENGNRFQQERFDSEGHPCGLTKRWYRTGVLRETETRRHGNVNGKCEGFYPNGERMYSLTCRDSVLVGKAQVWDDAGSLIAEGAFRDGEWTETVRVPGYIIHVPKAEVTKYPEYTVICPQHHFSVEIDPKGPIADKYKRFLEEAEGETNAVVEVRNDEFGLIIMTGTSSTNGLHYRLKIDGKRWKIDYKGNWEKTGNEYLFH